MFQTGNPGRPKGSLNKVKNVDIRAQVYDVFDRLGENKKMTGTEFFLSWARKNPRLFYTGIFIKICPAQLDITDNRQHESFIDRMAQTMLEAEAKVIDSKVIDTHSQLQGIQSSSKALPMGKDTNIVHGNGGHMEDNDIDKEVNHPIIKAELSDDVSSEGVDS